MWRAGFGAPLGSIVLIHLESMKCAYDPYDWGNRTMQTAHLWLQERWDEHRDGAVLDVQFIHLMKEAKELEEKPHSAEEMADVFMLGALVVHRVMTQAKLARVDLNAACQAKLEVNRKREWQRGPN